jgi:hypothetical protein
MRKWSSSARGSGTEGVEVFSKSALDSDLLTLEF